MTIHYFTFGQDHMTNFPLPNGGKLCDYWVAVEADGEHREKFISEFTTQYCPRPSQWAMEYPEDRFDRYYFPAGELTRIVTTSDMKD